MRVLVVNAGSSSLKLALVDGDDRISQPQERTCLHSELQRALAGMHGIEAVGHRIVHGGERFAGPVLIDARVQAQLQELAELAPLHQPKSLAALEAVSKALPGVPAVACFDTAFHAALPAAAHTYALPASWRRQLGIRRYGFHGLSHAWVARHLPELLGVPAAELRVVSCHLGAGASLCAIAGGRSVDTTMGFTPLDGLVMATRSGSVDPGALLWALERRQTGLDPPAGSAAEMADALEHRSGLLGLGGSADMRELLRAEAGGEKRAALAIAVYLHRLRAAVGAMAASMDGLDALVFTGGVGEAAPAIRWRAAERLSFLGVALDPGANARARADHDIGAPGATVAAWVLRAHEDLQIAQEVRSVLAA